MSAISAGKDMPALARVVPRVISGRKVVLAGERASLEVRHVSDVSHDGRRMSLLAGRQSDDWRFVAMVMCRRARRARPPTLWLPAGPVRERRWRWPGPRPAPRRWRLEPGSGLGAISSSTGHRRLNGRGSRSGSPDAGFHAQRRVRLPVLGRVVQRCRSGPAGRHGRPPVGG